MIAYSLRAAIAEAKHRERTNHKPHYIVRCGVRTSINTYPNMPIYNVTSRMPLLGEWYTSDGIQHGE